MYGIGGEHNLSELELSHLRGWRDSRPVRVGNGAWEQVQLDVYGELLNSLYVYPERLGPPAPAWKRRTGPLRQGDDPGGGAGTADAEADRASGTRARLVMSRRAVQGGIGDPASLSGSKDAGALSLRAMRSTPLACRCIICLRRSRCQRLTSFGRQRLT